MCGRTRCTLTVQQVAQACGLNPRDASSVPTLHMDRFRPSYNVAPGAHLPVFRVRRSPPSSSGGSEAAAGPVVHCMKWGLIPSFTKKTEKPDHYRMFNARSESIRERPAFRRLIPNNRCLVAVEGFYEWKKDGSKKQPYYIHFKDDQPLVFASLYDSWENSEGEVLYTFTILTTRASSALEWLHDRMPVIFRDVASMNIWLNDFSTKHESILGPCEDSNLVWYPVTPAMGKTTFDGPECIKEVRLEPAGQKPLSEFFAKKTEVKCQSQTDATDATEVKCESEAGVIEVKCKSEDALGNLKHEAVNSSKQERALKQEREDEDVEEEVADGRKKSHIETSCDIKRELNIETSSEPVRKNIKREKNSPAKKKAKVVKKTTDEKQQSLRSYFGKG